jgi:hypothetical protein
MARKKKIPFRLNPEWMFKEPVDFEYNKYTLLGYLQKCEQRFENFEIYPDFIELSLHLANLQSLLKENTLLLTEKKFEDCDDEILLKELYPKIPPKLEQSEQEELDKTVRYSTSKIFDAFNLGKSIWNVAYDTIHIALKKNRENIHSGLGFAVYYDKKEDEVYVWEYSIKKSKKSNVNSKTYMTLIYNGTPKETTISHIIEENTTLKENNLYKIQPVFEVKCEQKYPMKETLVPMIRRKIMSYIFQIVNLKKMEGFDQTK